MVAVEIKQDCGNKVNDGTSWQSTSCVFIKSTDLIGVHKHYRVRYSFCQL